MPRALVRLPQVAPMPDPKAPARTTRHLAVKAATEPWSEYQLEDGTVVRVRLVLHSFRRVVGAFAPNGDPEYEWAMQPSIELVVPDSLRDIPGERPAKLQG